MSKAGQLTIAFICGMDRDHPIVKNLMSDTQEIGRELFAGVKITKKDLFDTIGARHSFLEYAETWEHLDEIIKTIRAGGESFKGQDFTDVVMNGKSALDFAREKDATKHIFCPEVWEGQGAEMERVWFRIPKDKRDEASFLALRRAIANAEGRELREDAFERMGLNLGMLRGACSSGNFDTVRERLAAHDDHLRASDVFMLDSYGDHILDSSSAINNFDKVYNELMRHGEKLEVTDFLFKHHDRKSILEFATSNDALGKIFSAKVWQGRPQEMLALLACVPADNRKGIPVNELLREIEEETYNSKIVIGPELNKGMLTSVMNDAAKGEMPVRGLGLRKAWEAMPAILRILENNGEQITAEDLRLPSGERGETIMAAAARFGKFDMILDIMAAQNETLSVEELCAKPKDGQSILDSLVKQKKMALIMQP
ncbi:MAG TPA: hypothetical protein VIG74_01975, partial [Alphaproteobacteria bacterium]